MDRYEITRLLITMAVLFLSVLLFGAVLALV